MINRRDFLIGSAAVGASLIAAPVIATPPPPPAPGFYQYQRRWIEDESRFAVWTKDRQVGATTAALAQAIRWATRGEFVFFLSIGERMTLYARDLCAEAIPKANLKMARASTLYLKDGGRIHFAPTPLCAKGWSGNVILDEFDFMENRERTWDCVAGMTTHGGKLRVISSVNRKDPSELFASMRSYRLWPQHRTTFDDAVAVGHLREEHRSLCQIAV